MALTRDLIRISVRGKARTDRKLLAAEREVERALDREIGQLTRRVKAIFVTHAPGRLGRKIRTVPDARVGQVGRVLTIDARDPDTGYDYLGVTRFGHRRRTITPRGDRGRADIIASLNPRGPHPRQPQAALRIELAGGLVIFRRSVRGHKPATDWVSDARTEARSVVQATSGRLGRQVVSRLL